jgi:hypothetical protein
MSLARRRAADPTEAETGNGRMTTTWSDRNHLWSTDVRSHNLVADCLSKVHSGILQAAASLLLPLHAEDVAWLEDHDGRFQMHMHPMSNRHKQPSSQKRFCDVVEPEQVIKRHALDKKLHCSMVKSLRFVEIVGAANGIDSMEQRLRSFWNFLAIIGDHQSMLLLLPHPPIKCCSVSFRSLQAHVLHKFNLS